MKTEQSKQREQAIEAYKSIANGKVTGVSIRKNKIIKVGAISFEL